MLFIKQTMYFDITGSELNLIYSAESCAFIKHNITECIWNNAKLKFIIWDFNIVCISAEIKKKPVVFG